MKTISIPAQITTIEDRIAGNLTLTQLALLSSPVFVDLAIYAALPTPMHLYLYKLLLMILLTITLFTLAIRVKGTLILFLGLTLVRFKLRPKLYVFNKNCLTFRTSSQGAPGITETRPEVSVLAKTNNESTIKEPPLDFGALATNLSFIEERKGRLHVYVSETK